MRKRVPMWACVNAKRSRAGESANEFKPYKETISGTMATFEMVPIQGGTFLMGSPPGEPGRADDEGPQHPVTIAPFWMGKTEVTWDEFDPFWKPDDAKPANPTP